jgi:hypothetical protein
MKKREPRRRVMLPARMRLDGRWIDVSIRNLSSRGMQITAQQPVDRGAYVEIRRGRHVVIGRAVWRQGDSFGLQAQDRIDLDGITDRPEATAALQPNGAPERRWRPRPTYDPGRSARWGSHMQAAGLGLVALAAAFTVAQTAHQTLRAALGDASQALIHEERRLGAEGER